MQNAYQAGTQGETSGMAGDAAPAGKAGCPQRAGGETGAWIGAVRDGR